MTKYLFLTGGVISSIGKGVTSSSLGALFKARNMNITIIKVDGYLNIDAGLMSPYEHGEVFITDDGAQTDLDIGNYERFLDMDLSQYNNLTSGKIYVKVLRKERKGEYLGETVQVIPHVTNEIKKQIYDLSEGRDLVIVEIGGVVGDMENQIFIEACRQISLEKQSTFVHLGLIPFLSYMKEVKTKPIQNSVKALLSQGIQPNFIICRTSQEIPKIKIKKISLMTNVNENNIFQSIDIEKKYFLPCYFRKIEIDKQILQHLDLFENFQKIDFTPWEELMVKIKQKGKKVKLGMICKYTEGSDNYVSLVEALNHSSWNLGIDLELHQLNAENDIIDQIKQMDCILIPGGYGKRGTEGKIQAIKYARENNIPFLGICLGFQLSLVEFGRHVLELKSCNSIEMDENCLNPIIERLDFVQKDKKIFDKNLIFPNEQRIGSKVIHFVENSGASKIYLKKQTKERFRHRYSFNLKYKKVVEENGGLFSAYNTDEKQHTQELFEIPTNKFFYSCQFHPEFISRPFRPHPLITSFLNSVNQFYKCKTKSLQNSLLQVILKPLLRLFLFQKTPLSVYVLNMLLVCLNKILKHVVLLLQKVLGSILIRLLEMFSSNMAVN